MSYERFRKAGLPRQYGINGIISGWALFAIFMAGARARYLDPGLIYLHPRPDISFVELPFCRLYHPDSWVQVRGVLPRAVVVRRTTPSDAREAWPRS